MKKTLIGIILGMSALFTPGLGHASAYSAMYVFGDSLSDNGNLAAYGVPFPNGYVGDRFSNGPVAVEQLAGILGIAPANFHDFAFGGAETGTANPDLTGTALANTGVKSQVLAYAAGGAADPNALYFLWAGANDLLNGVENHDTLGQLLAIIQAAIANIGSEIDLLHTLGAQHFLVPNLTDLGLTPLARSFGTTEANALSLLAATFNQALAASLPAYVTQVDTFSLLDQVVADPAAYGLGNVADACTDGTTVCGNPGQYLFWDALHPTTAADAFLAADFAAAVPEPASLALLVLGLLTMMMRRTMFRPLAVRGC